MVFSFQQKIPINSLPIDVTERLFPERLRPARTCAGSREMRVEIDEAADLRNLEF